jgi:hypothetical protein
MKKTRILWPYCLLFLGIIGCVNEEGQHAHIKKSEHGIIIQNSVNRIYLTISLPLISEIDLAETEPPLFKPEFLQADDRGFVYTLSWRNYRIYKFSLGRDFKKKDLVVFGRGRGQGPGELSQPMDLKVLGEKIYISDQNTGALEIYSTSGAYIKRVTFYDKKREVSPERIVPMEGGLVIHTLRKKPGMLFALCDESGSVICNFGSHYNQRFTSMVLLDGQTSKVFSTRKFYFFPLYLGFTYLFDEKKMIFMRETIDGLRNMDVKETDISIEKARTYLTAISFAIGRDFIIVRTRDREKKKSDWDVYRLDDFEYLFSLKGFPPSTRMAIVNNYLIGLDLEKLTVYRLDDLLLHVKKALSSINASKMTSGIEAKGLPIAAK